MPKLGLYFSLKREPSVVKTGRRCYILICLDFFFEKKDEFKITLINRNSFNLISHRIKHKVFLLVMLTVFAV